MRTILIVLSLLVSLPAFGALSQPRVGGTEVLPARGGNGSSNIFTAPRIFPNTNFTPTTIGRALVFTGTNGALGESTMVADSTLVTTSNAILAIAPVTVATLADLIALSPATNLVFMKARSGTNGVGSGFWELRGTNGWTTNDGTIVASTAPRKFWFRLDPSPLNATWFGAVPDGVTDSTIGLQKWADMHTNGVVMSRLPLGDYKITSTLSITGYNAGDGWRMSGEYGRPRGPLGSRILWYGASGGTMMQLMGVNASTLEHLVLDARSVAKFALTIDARNSEGVSPSSISSGIRLKGVILSGTVGAESAALQYSHTSAGSPQTSEITVEDCFFQGTTGSDYGVRSLGIGNTKNFSFYNTVCETFTNGFAFLSGNGLLRFDNITTSSSKTNLVIGPGCVLEVNGWYGESDGFYLFQAPGGASRSSASINGLEWNGNTTETSGTNDVVIYAGSQLTIKTSSLRNARTASAIPIIIVDSPFIATNAAIRGSVISEANYYENATVPPLYGVALAGGYNILTNQWLFHRTGGERSGTNVAAFSVNDMGGVGGALIPFKSYDKTGGDTAVDYLEVFGSGKWFDNKLSVGTNGGTGVLNLHGAMYANGLGTSAAPISVLGRLGTGQVVESPLGSGDFVGPSSATDNAVLRYDTTTGKLGQNSGVIISDTTNVTGLQALSIVGPLLISAVGGANEEIKLVGDNAGMTMQSASANANGGYFWKNSGGTVKWFVGMNYQTAATQWEVSEPGGARFVIEPGGNVGINTNDPAFKFQTHGTVGMNALSSNAAPASFLARLSTGEIVETATPAGGGGSTPNGPFGAIQWGETSILRGTNSLLWTNDTLILNNPDTTGSRYFYWSFGNLVTPAFSVQSTTNLWLLQSDFGSSGPRFIRARKDDRSLTFGGISSLSSITNDATVYNMSNVVDAGNVAVTGTLTVGGGITNTSATAMIESAGGLRATRAAGSAAPGELSLDSTNGFVFSLQAGLMGSNIYFFTPTNVPVGLTDPVLTVSNLVHGAGGWTGRLAFVDRAIFGGSVSGLVTNNAPAQIVGTGGFLNTNALNLNAITITTNGQLQITKTNFAGASNIASIVSVSEIAPTNTVKGNKWGMVGSSFFSTGGANATNTYRPYMEFYGVPTLGGSGQTLAIISYTNAIQNAEGEWIGQGQGVTNMALTSAGAVTFTGSLTAGNASVGALTASGNIELASGSYYKFGSSSRAAMNSPVNGVLVGYNAALDDFNAFLFGGSTAAFPGLGRTNGDLIVFGGNRAFTGGSTNRLLIHGGLAIGPPGAAATVTNTLAGSAPLDFPSTTAGSFSDLVIPVTGVTSNGCHVSLSIPWQSASGGGVFNSYNSNDAVYVRFANNNLTLAIDPNPGTFGALVFRTQ